MTQHIIGIIIGTIILIILLVLLSFFYTKHKKHQALIKRIGQRAETQINDDLKVWAKHTKNFFTPAALYKYNHNKYFEVDGLLITNKVLIVIEIKSIKGEIIGDADALYWNKRLGEQTFRILNPIVQNERHIDHIVAMSQIKVPTLSLIIFSNRASYLKVNNIPNHVLVTKHAEMFEVLDQIEHTLPVVFSDYEMKNIIASLRNFRTTKKSDYQYYRKLVYGSKK